MIVKQNHTGKNIARFSLRALICALTVVFCSIPIGANAQENGIITENIAQENAANATMSFEKSLSSSLNSYSRHKFGDSEQLFASSTTWNYVSRKVTTTRQEISYVAIKTNLLYDMATAINAEVELPLGLKWSIAGEFLFPWWTADDNSAALQFRSGTLEAKYWFAPVELYGVRELTGWFVGIYGNMGICDIQSKGEGVQGDFFSAGFTGGYAQPLDKQGRIRMEYSLSLGYQRTLYDKYYGVENNEILLWTESGIHTWVGPTRLRVSFVWMIGNGKGKGSVW